MPLIIFLLLILTLLQLVNPMYVYELGKNNGLKGCRIPCQPVRWLTKTKVSSSLLCCGSGLREERIRKGGKGGICEETRAEYSSQAG